MLRSPSPKLRPIIGYLMYQLREGLTQEEALIKAMEYKTFANLPVDLFYRAMCYARINHDATKRCLACEQAHWQRLEP